MADGSRIRPFRQTANRGEFLRKTGAELYNNRIVGLPGEEIPFRDGILYVNGCAVTEPYVQE